jgi:hypothetical protein
MRNKRPHSVWKDCPFSICARAARFQSHLEDEISLAFSSSLIILNNSMEHCPSWKILATLVWKLEVHYCIHKILLLASELSRMNQALILMSLMKLHLIFSSHLPLFIPIGPLYPFSSTKNLLPISPALRCRSFLKLGRCFFSIYSPF